MLAHRLVELESDKYSAIGLPMGTLLRRFGMPTTLCDGLLGAPLFFSR